MVAGKTKRQTETRSAAQKMKRILIHLRGQMDEQLRPQGVTIAQLQMLKMIQKEPGVSGAGLARACFITPQSAQALLKSLEEDGWIRREKDKVNDRIRIASITPSGEKLLAEAESAALVIENKIWRGIPDSSVKTLNEILAQCLENLGLDAE
ncbi:MarR family winged helix-turn-helix transcriptional regulator [Edaphobacter flagellatus]|uniref:MarR family winged helix-turn-helix transcriptional regulator n=1 Tax=Edaphobacter flagellatus TaxID=1933044 RepID=UPI0021B4AD82|nr:MarR family transcriptional regulator [Edaphobacter flagellatus]